MSSCLGMRHFAVGILAVASWSCASGAAHADGPEDGRTRDGRSLLPLLRGEVPQDWRQYSFSELDFSEPLQPTLWQKALGTTPSDSSLGILRDGRFTLVEFAADLPPMLFDAEGQGELENVAGQPDYASDLNRLTRMMLRHRMKNMDHTLSLMSITPDGARGVARFPQPKS